MSYNLVDPTTGDLTQVAGRGRAEYGASTVRTGSVRAADIPADGSKAVNVIFDTPMPDSDYEVFLTVNNWIAQATVSSVNKTANGFTVYIYNEYATVQSADITYKAFKLYSDVEYSNIVNSMPSNASPTNKLATASDIPNITPLEQSVAAIEGKIPANASTSNKMATASDIPNITPLQQSVAAIEEKIPSNASTSNKMATQSDIPNITPLEQSIQTLSSTKLQAGGGIITISDQFQWLKPEVNAIRYTNNTGRPILVTGLFIQGVTAYTTNMKDDGTVVAAFSNLTGRTDFTFTLTAVIKAGGVLAVYNDKPEGDAALLCSLSAQVL